MPRETRTAAAVFVDLENIEYGFRNKYGYPVDWNRVFEKIRAQYNVHIMAFAPFVEARTRDSVIISGTLKRWLQRIGVQVHDLPHTLKDKDNLADMSMINWMWKTAIDTGEQFPVFIIMSGDSDLVETTNFMRNRFGKQIIAYGVQGSVAQAMTFAADEVWWFDDLHQENNEGELKDFLASVVERTMKDIHDRWFTFSSLRDYAKSRRSESLPEIEQAIRDLIGAKLLEQIEIPDSHGQKIPRLKFVAP